MNEDRCLLTNTTFQNVVQLNKSGKKEKQFSVCVTDNNDVYVSDVNNSSISRLSPSGSVSPVFSTAPLKPVGICQTKDVGLLITLRDTESDTYQPNSDSQRLVRHVTLVFFFFTTFVQLYNILECGIRGQKMDRAFLFFTHYDVVVGVTNYIS